MAPPPDAPQSPSIRPDVRAALRVLYDRGHWRRLAPAIERHGADSPQCRAIIVAILGTSPCPACGRPVCTPTKRVRHCSDRCRRAYAEGAGQCADCDLPLTSGGAVCCRPCRFARRRAAMVSRVCPDCGREISRVAARCYQCAIAHRLAARCGG